VLAHRVSTNGWISATHFWVVGKNALLPVFRRLIRCTSVATDPCVVSRYCRIVRMSAMSNRCRTVGRNKTFENEETVGTKSLSPVRR
jgi:hypothetical protein